MRWRRCSGLESLSLSPPVPDPLSRLTSEYERLSDEMDRMMLRMSRLDGELMVEKGLRANRDIDREALEKRVSALEVPKTPPSPKYDADPLPF